MRKLVVMLLITSFAAFGTVAYAHEGTTKTQSDSTMTKKMTKKGKWSKSKKMNKKKTSSAKKDSTMSEPKEN